MANVAPPDAAAVVFVRSSMAHAKLLAVELDQARRMPGVLAVVDAESLGANPTPGFPPIPRPDFLQRHLLATDRVRFVGQPIAAIVADTLSQAIDAADAVIVDATPPFMTIPATSNAVMPNRPKTNSRWLGTLFRPVEHGL